MSDNPVNIDVRRKPRKRRVLIRKADLDKLNYARQLLLKRQQEILWSNPDAASVVMPQSNEIKPATVLVEEYLKLTGAALAPSTMNDKVRNLKVFTDWLGPRPLTRETVELFNVDLHKAPFAEGTRWFVGTTFASFLNWLYDSKRIPEDFRRGVKFPRHPRQVPRPVYTPEEVKKLIEVAGDRPIGFVILLAYQTGMAITDATNLLWGQVDMDKLTITRNRQKTGVESVITVKFGSELHQALERQREDTIRAFNSCDKGLPVCRWAFGNKHAFYTLMKRLCKVAGIPYRSFHSFRSTMATDLANSNTPINVSLKVLGLRTVQQFMQYATTPVESVRAHMERLR